MFPADTMIAEPLTFPTELPTRRKLVGTRALGDDTRRLKPA